MHILRTTHAACAALMRSIMPHGKNTARTRHARAALKEMPVRPEKTDGHVTLLRYRDDTVRNFIHAMKYEKDGESIRHAAELLRDTLSRETMRGRTPGTPRIICAVPMTKTRKRKDGYDHIHAILDAYFLNDTGGIGDGRNTLIWRRHVERQSTMKNREERIRNMDGAMRTESDIRKDAVYIVFDDVMTTGATLAEARRVLKDAGVRTIITLALAH